MRIKPFLLGLSVFGLFQGFAFAEKMPRNDSPPAIQILRFHIEKDGVYGDVRITNGGSNAFTFIGYEDGFPLLTQQRRGMIGWPNPKRTFLCGKGISEHRLEPGQILEKRVYLNNATGAIRVGFQLSIARNEEGVPRNWKYVWSAAQRYPKR